METKGSQAISKKKRLPTSLSKSNMQMSEALRKKLEYHVFLHSQQHHNCPFIIGHMAWFSILLPDLTQEDKALQQLVKERLIDYKIQRNFESAKIINFSRTVHLFYPLNTAGDGNCLLHAVSLAIWGVPDEAMLLRRLVYLSLVEDFGNAFRKRWKSERMRLDNEVPEGMKLSKKQWNSEWDMVVQYAEDQEKTEHINQLPFEPLEEVHIFVLANVIQRPIVVVSESVVRSFKGSILGPNNFAGIYLPLMWDPSKCHRVPIILGYHNAHFVPLVNMSHSSQDSSAREYVIPLVNSNLEPLYIHFLSISEAKDANSILQKYLDVCEINWTKPDGLTLLLSARLEHKQIPKKYDLISDFIKIFKESLQESLTEKELPSLKQKDVISVSPEEHNEDSLFYTFVTKENNDDASKKTPTDNEMLTEAKLQQTKTQTEEQLREYDEPQTSPVYIGSEHHKCISSHCKYPGLLEYCGYCCQCFLKETNHVKLEFLEKQLSTANSRCQFMEQCRNLASVKTFPYCREHAAGHAPSSSHFEERQSAALEAYELSVTDYQCHFPGCTYAASKNTFPFCHEHKGKKSDLCHMELPQNNPLPRTHQQTKMVEGEFDYGALTSVLPHFCHHKMCINHASKMTFPYCHEHSQDLKHLDEDTEGISKSLSPNTKSGTVPPFIGQSVAVKNSKQMVLDHDNAMQKSSVRHLSSQHTKLNCSKHCLVPGCPLYCPPVLNDYCIEHHLLGRTNRVCCVDSCNNQGNAKKLGMCEECWLKACHDQKMLMNDTAEHGQAPVKEQFHTKDGQIDEINKTTLDAVLLCVGPQCSNKANPELGGLCDDCYSALSHFKQVKDETTTRKHGHPKPSGEDQLHDATEQPNLFEDLLEIEKNAHSSAKCSTEQCHNFGNPAKHGYCNSCYNQLFKRN